jgi:hypothetical protein
VHTRILERLTEEAGEDTPIEERKSKFIGWMLETFANIAENPNIPDKFK